MMSLFDDERINIIPIRANSKEPGIAWGQYQTEKYPREKLKNWTGNFAVVCGGISNNLVIVDLDDPEIYEKLKDISTLTVKTPRGYHLYFFTEKEWRKIPNFAGKKIDLLGSACYALIPPSKVNDIPYEIIKNVEIAEVEDIGKLIESKIGEDKRLKSQLDKGFKEIKEIKINNVKETFKKWLCLKDDRVVEVVCAAVIANWFAGDPVWLFLIGASGGSKTEILRSLINPKRMNDGSEQLVYSLSKLTPNTLITGKPNTPDLLMELNGKTVLIKDFSSILSLKEDARAQVFSDLREVYDGYLDKAYGSGKGKVGYNCKLGMIVGTTAAIDRYHSVNQMLGERFLRWHLDTERSAVKKAEENAGLEEEMRAELHTAMLDYLFQIKGKYKGYFEDIKNLEIPEDISKEIRNLADLCALLRTSVPRDHEGVMPFQPDPEIGTRLVKSLKKMLMSIALVNDRVQPNEHDLDIIRQIAFDTIPKRETRILVALLTKISKVKSEKTIDKYFKTRDIALEVKIPTRTVGYVLDSFAVLNIADKIESPESKREEDNWSILPNLIDRLISFLFFNIEQAKRIREYKSKKDSTLVDFACSIISDDKPKNDLGIWIINYFKNHPGIPKTLFVNETLKMFPAADPVEIQKAYDMLKSQEVKENAV